MVTIPGIYENGKIELLRKVPAATRQKVLITFIEEDEDDTIRFISLNKKTGEMEDYLEDKNEDIYQDYLSKKQK